jgi:hypothetical protein
MRLRPHQGEIGLLDGIFGAITRNTKRWDLRQDVTARLMAAMELTYFLFAADLVWQFTAAEL